MGRLDDFYSFTVVVILRKYVHSFHAYFPSPRRQSPATSSRRRRRRRRLRTTLCLTVVSRRLLLHSYLFLTPLQDLVLLPSSTAAAISSSRVRNFRRRAEEDDNDDQDKEKITTISQKPQSATSKPKKRSLLSFTDDESTDMITPIFSRSRICDPNKQPGSSPISKPSPLSSSSTHKLTSARDRNSAKERISLNVQPQAGVYTKEALLELQKNTKTLEEKPEFQGTIALIGEKSEATKGVFEDVRKENEGNGSDNGVEDEEDEEDKMWEEEQFRKGLGKRMYEGVAIRGSIPTIVQNVEQKVAVSSYPSINGGPGIGWSSGSDTKSISQQAELSKKALHENLRRLEENHGRTLASLTKTEENLSDSLTKVTVLENALTAAGEKFMFMQELCHYVSAICDFLQEKAPFVEELEYQMQKLHKERAEAIFERRAADSNDELMELEPSVNAAMVVLNKGGNTDSMVESARIAAQAALSASQKSRNLPVKLDKFGRDMILHNRMDIKRRAESRQRRKARSDSKRIQSLESDSGCLVVEGELSTDESDSESTSYESNRDQLLQIAGQIFSDSDEIFSQLSSVKERFEIWKKDYTSSYQDAYMSLSIPAIFSPYVKLELLKWDPLHQASDFIDMQWHELLFNYGQPEDESKVDPFDADVNLVPDLIEKVVIPILQHEIAHCWDMMSTKETKYAVSATNLVLRYVPLSSKAVTELVAVLHDRLSHAVTNLMVPTWNTLVLKAVPNADRFAAYKFGMSVRLMKNICLWNNVLSTSIIEKLALDELLSGKILPHLRSIQSPNIHDAITRAERIVTLIFGVWTGPSVTADRSPRLQPFVDYLVALGKTLEERQSSLGTNVLACRLKKMLIELDEYDRARHFLEPLM